MRWTLVSGTYDAKKKKEKRDQFYFYLNIKAYVEDGNESQGC